MMASASCLKAIVLAWLHLLRISLLDFCMEVPIGDGVDKKLVQMKVALLLMHADGPEICCNDRNDLVGAKHFFAQMQMQQTCSITARARCRLLEGSRHEERWRGSADGSTHAPLWGPPCGVGVCNR
jgi:hypothetical protein